MSYEEFHCMIDGVESWDPRHDRDPCEAIFGHGSPNLTWPALSYQNVGDSYKNTWMYDHLRAVAIWGSVGAWIEAHEEGLEDSDEEGLEDSDEEECLS